MSQGFYAKVLGPCFAFMVVLTFSIMCVGRWAQVFKSIFDHCIATQDMLAQRKARAATSAAVARPRAIMCEKPSVPKKYPVDAVGASTATEPVHLVGSIRRYGTHPGRCH